MENKMDAGTKKEVAVFKNFSRESKMACAMTMSRYDLVQVLNRKTEDHENKLNMIENIVRG